MKVSFWGVRGSIPTPGPETVMFGGNTSCVSVETSAGRVFIFDAGTGIRECGNYLMSKGVAISATLFLSHTHWDHIQGFPFFVPAYLPGNSFAIYGPPSDVQNLKIREIMKMQTNYEYFPIRVAELGASLSYEDTHDGILLDEENLKVEACKLNHPVSCYAYKLTSNDKVYVYGGDHEPFRNIYRDEKDCELDEDFLQDLDRNAEEQNAKIVEFIRGADLVSWDSMYTSDEYKTKKGWGHGTYDSSFELAVKAEVKHMIFTHHDPMSNDSKLLELEKKYSEMATKAGFDLTFSREHLEFQI